MWVWLQSLRPCRRRETIGGFTILELHAKLAALQQSYDDLVQVQALERANDEQEDGEFRAQIDRAVSRNDTLRGLVREIRKITDREVL